MNVSHAANPLLHDLCSIHEPCAEHKPESCRYEPIRKKRAVEKQGGWGGLVARKEIGGMRHYLDGKPVHCGAGLLLQQTEDKSDDYGEYSVPLQRGTLVRYEASQDGKEIDVTLFLYLGGSEFTTSFQPWMRFRWPR